MRVRTGGKSIAATLLVGLLAACGGGRPGSPEELFEEVARLNEAGESGKLWDLMTPEAQQEQAKGFAALRLYLRRNPDPNGTLHTQFECTREEIQTLSDQELFRRGNLKTQGVLVGAKIVDKHEDPLHPGDELLLIETRDAGFRVHLRARKMPDRGYAMAEPMQLEQR